MDPMNFGVLAFVLAALPTQSQLPTTRLHRITAPVRNAGILHVATNTWTRKASSASLGADTVYDNTALTGYYSALSGDTYIDEGRLPSLTSPTNWISRPGCATSYTIDGFQVAYCTDRASPAPFQVNFYGAYVSCSSVIGVTPTAGFQLAGLPGSPSGTATACWTITIDLGAPPGGSGLAFTMLADGDGTYTSPADSNRFGWSFRSTAAWSEQAATGPFIAGDPNTTLFYDGTRWDDLVNYAESGTGMGSAAAWRIEGGPTPPGCYWFQSNPYESFHLELYADACVGATLGSQFCFGDAFPNPCPCGNSPPASSGSGCRNSLGVGGRLRTSGEASLTSDTFVLSGDQMPPTAPTLYYQGTTRLNGGFGTHFGDGLRCVGGTVVRLLVVSNAASGGSQLPTPGSAPVSVLGQVTAPGLRTYQAWYRNAANFCTSATFNLTNGMEIAWAP